MSWATRLKHDLQEGKVVKVKPKGNSMTPLITSGQEVKIIPADTEDIKVGDIVLCTVKGKDYLHIVKAINKNSFLIGNNHGRINGWTRKIYGKFIK